MKIEDLRVINHPVLKASFTVVIPEWQDFCLRECKLFEQQGKRWVSLPDREYEKDGEKKYWPLCGFKTRETNDAFKAKVRAALDEVLEQKPKTIPHSEDTPF